jgi:ribokinase
MPRILVSGLINIETTVRVDAFPIAYTPVRFPFFGVNSTVSGVGYNIARALTVLGDEVAFLSLIGRDMAGQMAQAALARDGIPAADVLTQLERTPQSAILYDPSGRRQINVDLKDVQEQTYPPERFTRALEGCSLAALCNVNFSRPFLALAKQAGVPIATDVHTIADLDDPYNRDFMAAADILFMSDELLPCPPDEWARRVLDRYSAQVVVIGLGAQGALLAVRAGGFIGRFPAVQTRPVVSTIGAGDALFSAFVHTSSRTRDPYEAIRRAIVYASYKIGAAGAAEGLLSAVELEALAGSLM